jgi:hypothetical protein
MTRPRETAAATLSSASPCTVGLPVRPRDRSSRRPARTSNDTELEKLKKRGQTMCERDRSPMACPSDRSPMPFPRDRAVKGNSGRRKGGGRVGEGRREGGGRAEEGRREAEGRVGEGRRRGVERVGPAQPCPHYQPAEITISRDHLFHQRSPALPAARDHLPSDKQ